MLPTNEAVKKWLTDNSVENYKLQENEVFNPNRNEVLCKKCGKPKKRLSWSDTIGNLVYRPVEEKCDCEKARIAEEERQKRISFCKSYYNTELYLEEINKECRYSRLDTIPENLFHDDFYAVRDSLREWVGGYKPGYTGISIIGDVGLGKSTLMACLRNELLDRGYSCAMSTISNIMRHQSNRTVRQNEFSYDTYWNVDVLIIDDIGADFSNQGIRKSDYNSTLFSIVNFRDVNHRTTCYTSNLSKQKLINLGVDNRAIDRLKEMVSVQYMLEGESIRGSNKQSN